LRMLLIALCDCHREFKLNLRISNSSIRAEYEYLPFWRTRSRENSCRVLTGIGNIDGISSFGSITHRVTPL